MERKITTSPTSPMIQHINLLLNKAQAILFMMLLLLLFNTQQALSQITISEDFDYGTSAGNLAGQSGGSGFAAAWTGGTGGYIPTGLTFGALSSAGGAQSGSHFARQITTGFAASGPVSGSFLFQMTSASNSVEMLGLQNGGAGNNQQYQLGFLPANDGQGGKPALAVRNGTISAMTAGASLTQGTTYMYAFSYSSNSTSAWILTLSQYNNFFDGTTLDQTAMNAASIGTGSTNVTGKATIAGTPSSTMNYLYTYWFGGGSMTIDRIRMSGTAALSGLGSAVAGAALNFDGVNDYVTLPNESNFDFTNAMTVEAWFKVNAFDVNKDWTSIVTKGDNSWRLTRYASSNNITFIVQGGSQATSTTNFNDGSWHHVAGVYTGTNVLLYVDGNLEASAATSVTIPNSTYNVAIGENLQQTGRYFDGSIDEVRIWNTARTCDQIRQLRNCELAGNESGLVAYYKFNQGTAAGDNTALPTLTDATANGNNGTFSGFALNGSSSNFIATGGVTTGVSCGAVLAPEINLKGNTVAIASGATTPATTNHTNFGAVVSGASFARTFTIENTGTGALTVSSITSSNSQFVVSNIPPSVSASGTATFTVTFTPTGYGLQTATITVNNDDCDESVYTFTVQAMTPFTLGFGCISGTIGNYYNGGAGPNVGVVFTTETAGGGSLSAWPSNPIINIPAGFTTGVAVRGDVCIGYGINIYSGLDGTGTLLATQANNLGVSSLAFSGVAKSIILARYSCPGTGYDDLTFGSTTIGSALAESTVEINVKGNNNNILDGTATTSTTTDTDFGTIAANTSLAKTYTIENTGSGTLTISSITSSNNKFVVSNIPPSVSGNSTATFTVTFNPTTTGVQNSTITITNDDCDETSYDFAITGTGYVQYTFNGTTNSDWATASNWSTGVVPTSLSSGDAVVIMANCTMTNVAALSFPSGTTMTINTSTTLTLNGTSALTTQSGATLTNNGTMTVNGTYTNNGTYKGSGTYSGSLFTNPSGGIVAPGNSAGCMTFSNGFTNNGTVQIEVGGITACSQSDKITVTGTATLGGTLSLTYINGYTGSGNQTVNIIDATALSGTFATVSGLLANWFNNYNAPSTGKVTLSYSAVLSAELLNFKATPSVSSVKLAWQTANEVNNKGFQVERRQATGDSWDVLGFIIAKGKDSSYDFVDNAPLSINYYRLRQLDNDGKETLSKVVSASLKGKGGLSIYPNPVSSHLTLSVLARNEATEGSDYQILNLLGKQVLSGKTTPQIDVSTLPQGTYVIKVGAEQAKFVKQ